MKKVVSILVVIMMLMSVSVYAVYKTIVTSYGKEVGYYSTKTI